VISSSSITLIIFIFWSISGISSLGQLQRSHSMTCNICHASCCDPESPESLKHI
jgi:hypothetical protein